MIAFALALSILAVAGATWAVWKSAVALNHFLELAAYVRSMDNSVTAQGELIGAQRDLIGNVSSRTDAAIGLAEACRDSSDANRSWSLTTWAK